MTYKEMQDDAIQARFNDNYRTRVQRWINLRHARIWGFAEWPFKKMPRQSASSDAASSIVIAGLGRVLHLERASDGEELEYMHPQDFQAAWPGGTLSSSGLPTQYTVINRIVYTRPISPSTPFNISYESRVSHLADGSTLTAGAMNSDLDTPVFEDAYHYLLVVGAIATGLKLENDPTWGALEQEFDFGLQAMVEDLCPPDHAETLQYGRDSFW